MPENFGIEEARAYIDKVKWQFAKTMPQYPHWYTIRQWNPHLDADFQAFASLIREIGIVKAWPYGSKKPLYHHAYLEIDEWEYWTMGAPVEETTVINRAKMTEASREAGRAAE
jgi:hypothetical protein